MLEGQRRCREDQAVKLQASGEPGPQQPIVDASSPVVDAYRCQGGVIAHEEVFGVRPVCIVRAGRADLGAGTVSPVDLNSGSALIVMDVVPRGH